MTRVFTSRVARRERVPLMIGITSVSGAGKTYSALSLATGIQRVYGGDLCMIDTEARRSLHYAGKFKFNFIDFQPPHGPLDYLAAIEHAVSEGAKTIVIDSMSHEHSGVGGVMDQIDTSLDDRAARQFRDKPSTPEWEIEKFKKKNFMAANGEPKKQRKRLNARIIQLGVNVIFCYRALDKIKPVSGGEPEKLGWQAETTSPLFYDMMVRFLLMPGADGRVTINPTHEAEKLVIKIPEQFRGWFKDGMLLSEDVGQRMAEWCMGTSEEQSSVFDGLLATIRGAATIDQLNATIPELKATGEAKSLPSKEYQDLRTAWAAQKKTIEQPSSEPREPGQEG